MVEIKLQMVAVAKRLDLRLQGVAVVVAAALVLSQMLAAALTPCRSREEEEHLPFGHDIGTIATYESLFI